MGPGFEIQVYLAALRRRLWLILLIFVGGSLLAASVAVLLPPVFKATATILVQAQQIPSTLAQSTITNGTQERLTLIRQQLMTRENLLDVADRLGLYADRPDLSPTQRAQKFRAATEIRSIPLNPGVRGNTQVASFRISFQSDEAQVAARVANEFVSLILERNLQTRLERATETSSFFETELKRIEGTLENTETRIAEYKRDNETALPETLALRREELAKLKDLEFQIDSEIISLEEEQRIIQAALDRGPVARPQPVAPTNRQLTPAERELAELQSNYRIQGSVYAESHPRMRILRNQMEALEGQITVELNAATEEQSADPQSEEPAFTVEESLVNAERRQRIVQIERQIGLLKERSADARAREVALAASIARTPDVEKALTGMDRERIDLEAQYAEIVSKLAEAEIGELLEVNRQSERFEVIEQAEVPTRPEKPNRLLILVAGVAASLMAGVGLVIGLELLNKSIRTAGDLERLLETHAFSVVPYIRTAGEVRMIWVSWILAFGLLLGAGSGAAFAVDRYYMPLTVVLDKVADRTGVQGIVTVIKDRISR